MNKSGKMLITVIAVLTIALPLMSAAFASEEDGQELVNDFQSEQRIRRFLLAQKLQQLRQKQSIWFFKGVVKNTLEDVTIKDMHKNTLIVQYDSDILNVVMPIHWYDETGEVVVSLQDMYVEIEDSTVTMQVLERTVTNEKGVSITIYFCYELTGYHAVLPYNISDDE